MLPRKHPDRSQSAFDDHRLDLGRAPGRANPGDKIMTLARR